MQRTNQRRARAALGALALLFVSSEARAFERQGHLGGGLGAAAASDARSPGAALGVYGAYGVSDVFDLRLELQASHHASHRGGELLAGARFGLSYKVDVMTWIPYAGLWAGGFASFDARSTNLRPSVGAFAGLDYAASRRFGVGVLLGGDYVLASPPLTIAALLVRAEYRFGY